MFSLKLSPMSTCQIKCVDLSDVTFLISLSYNKICSHHDIAEILLKLALNTNQSINQSIISNHNK